VEVRVTAAGDSPLSAAYGRDTGWFGCDVYAGTP